MKNEKPRVTGVGGIFFKSEDPEELIEWYKTNLGLETDQWGTNFEWYQVAVQQKKVLLNGVHSQRKLPILILPPILL